MSKTKATKTLREELDADYFTALRAETDAFDKELKERIIVELKKGWQGTATKVKVRMTPGDIAKYFSNPPPMDYVKLTITVCESFMADSYFNDLKMDVEGDGQGPHGLTEPVFIVITPDDL